MFNQIKVVFSIPISFTPPQELSGKGNGWRSRNSAEHFVCVYMCLCSSTVRNLRRRIFPKGALSEST